LMRRISEEVKQLSTQKPDFFAVTNERFRVERMERLFNTLTRTQAEIAAEMTLIAEEIDCAELLAMLRPFETLLRRATDVLNRCWMLIELGESLASHNAWLERQLGLAGPGLPPDFSRERFERLLNDCDHLADLLDGLERSGENVDALIGAYERMVAQVGQLQDRLDKSQEGAGSW
ncbi:MAG TPA: hypothetical protein V6D23_06615, partial [Candidatus Obscuribacterales bacterium]